MLERSHVEDTKDLLALIGIVQPHVPWTDEHLDWQFLQPPAGAARVYVVRDGARIVSLYVGVPQRLRTPAGLIRAFMIQDVMTHPDYRGRGLFTRLGRMCFDDMTAAGDVGYTFPNTRSEPGFRRLGWTEFGRVPLRRERLDDLPRTLSSDGTVRVTRPSDFAERAAAIWMDADVGTGVHRDSAFLRWRYSKPNASYDRVIIGNDRAYLVTKCYRQGGVTTLHVCDLVAREPVSDWVPRAIEVAIDAALDVRANYLTAWLPAPHPYARHFDRAGLPLVSDHDRFMFVTGPTARPWHLTQGDSDLY